MKDENFEMACKLTDMKLEDYKLFMKKNLKDDDDLKDLNKKELLEIIETLKFTIYFMKVEWKR